MNKIRAIKFEIGYLKNVPESCLISMGDTKVLCVASVELNKVPPHCEEKKIGWLSAEYSMLPMAGGTRTARQRSSSAGRTKEISRIIGRSLRASVDLEKLGKNTILIDCDVIQADGGTRTAAINGGFVAMMLLMKRLLKEKVLATNPLKNYVAAISAGIAGGKKILDLSAKVDNIADVDINVVMNGKDKFIEIQGSSEGETFDKKDLDELLKMASSGIREVIKKQKKILAKLNMDLQIQ